MEKKVGIKLSILVLLIGIFQINLVDASVFDGIVSYYNFDETSGTVAYDSAGIFNGTINITVVTINQEGKINTGYSFADLPSLNQINFTTFTMTGGSYTFSYWLKPTDVSTNPNQYIMTSPNPNTFWIDLAVGDPLQIGHYDGGVRKTGIQATEGVWKNYVFVFDGNSGRGLLYVNGTLKSNLTYSSRNIEEGFRMRDYNGLMDELGIWNRTLTESEVIELYNNGGGLEYFASDTTPPYFTTIPENTTIIYGGGLGVDFDAEDETEFGTFSINDTRFSINSTGFLDEVDTLGAGLYSINVTINDTSGNENSTIYLVEVQKGTPTTELYLNGGHTNTEIDITESVSIEGQLDVGQFGIMNLTIDGIEVNSTTSLTSITYTFDAIGEGLGNFIVGLNYSGNTNFTSDYKNYNISVVHVGIPVVNITYPISMSYYGLSNINLNYTVTEPVPDSCWYSKDGGVTNSSSVASGTNFTGISTTDGENTWIVYCNDTAGNLGYDSISFYIDTTPPTITPPSNASINYLNPLNVDFDASDLGIGVNSSTWNVNDTRFSINSTGGLFNNTILGVGIYEIIVSVNDILDNKQDISYKVNVTKLNGNGSLYLNNSQNNLTIEKDNLVEINATLDVGSGNISIYVNDTLYESGESPLYNISNFTEIGYYEIKLNYSGNTNFTSFEKSLYLNITESEIDETSPTITINNPTNGEQEGGEPITFNILTNEVTSCNYTLSGDLSQVNQSMTTSDNLTHTKSLTLDNGDYSVYFSCVDSSDNFNETNSIDFSIFHITTGGSTGGTNAEVETFYSIIDGEKINLTDLIIETNEICIGEKTKIYFKPIDSEGKLTNVDSGLLLINDTLYSNKFYLDTKKDLYYFNIEPNSQDLNVTIKVSQGGKEIIKSNLIKTQQCKTFFDKVSNLNEREIIYIILSVLTILILISIGVLSKKR